ncbi:kinesin-like protein KIN-14F isoform X2 [Papaver somniferum]|uniref:kinesin-like protein KIN-14F isoform X2 n=1 Tax=Papaver somniferum TaxID=3469 RepID=UPI000E705F7E|nr:kinesin-like protein KIN-14F isoform X2 [Papaver somniferum]
MPSQEKKNTLDSSLSLSKSLMGAPLGTVAQKSHNDSNIKGPNSSSSSSSSSQYHCSSFGDKDIIDDYELAQRKAAEAAWRRYQAVEWLQKMMDQGASESYLLPKQPTEEEFSLALRNGLILCNVLNKVNPGAISKVVENPILTIQSADGAAQSAIQYFENMRNFLVVVGNMKLLTFEASDLEKGGSSAKVVDCILCLKGYHEWKEAGGIGVWRYGGTVKITSLQKESSSSLSLICSSESTDESIDDSVSSNEYDQQILEFLHLSSDILLEESKAADALTFLFDRFGLELLRTYLTDRNGFDQTPLNTMLIDAVLRKVVHDFTRLLTLHGNQSLKGDLDSVSKAEFIKAISKYLKQRIRGDSNDFSKLCICGGKSGEIQVTSCHNGNYLERLDHQQKLIEELKSAFQVSSADSKQVISNWEGEVKRLEHHIQGLEVTSSSYHKVLEENRLLYNQVQDLKGSIRVYCRVRPFLPGQVSGQSTVDYIGENGNIMIMNPHKQGKDARRVFSFNTVFGTNVTQEEVFADTQPLIRSVLDGFNVCIFAYGQTGSGKTYTMSGPDISTEGRWGVNYRALRDLFEISKSRIDFVSYEVSVQMIEIYNEQVRDLLVTDGSNKRLDIRNNSQLNGLNIPDASLIPVTSTRDVLDLMGTGQRNRAVGATALNERSSRSHSVLTVHVQGKELISGFTLRGCLHLVDLAGSERVDKSEAVGDRLKEAQHINRSLSALGDVIYSLAQKSTHIPYRNSKLTQVLQDSLGGQAKTLMFVHINPEVSSIGETISTLKFAERVACIELGAARSNKETGEIRELKEELSNLKLALERKEAEVEQLKSGNVRAGLESQKLRTVSPLSLPRHGIKSSLKPESVHQPIDGARPSEVRSCSTGKERRSRFPSGTTNKDPIPMTQFLPEEGVTRPGKARLASSPLRRSMSTDRAAFTRNRLELDILDNKQPTAQVQIPRRAAVNKSCASITLVPPKENHTNVSDAYNLHSRKFHHDHEDEQFKQVLNVRAGGIRKSKPEHKTRAKHQDSTKIQRTDVADSLLSEIETERKPEVACKIESSEMENEHGYIRSFTPVSKAVKKLRQNFARSSQNLEPRGMQAMEPILTSGKSENKLNPNGIIPNGKESSAISSTPNNRRGRSSPHSKFVTLP